MIDPVTALANLGDTLINRLWPDPQQREAAKLELFRLQQAGELQKLANELQLQTAQIEVNKQDAASGSIFVAGARPFIMWGCGIAMLYAALLEPLMRFVAVVYFHYTGAFPEIDTTLTTQVLLGLLGLGSMRSFEKVKGVAR